MTRDDVIINKVEAIERCLKRVHEEYRGDQKLKLPIVVGIIEQRLGDFEQLIQSLVNADDPRIDGR